jgi:type II secretory ATPase GspE/PulE/Tfp pilus assembly ATPase PilB-like protein
MMFRRLMLLILVAALVLLCAGEVWAQQTSPWDAFPIQGKNWRGPGLYLSWLKIVGSWLVFLLWAWTTDWVNRDLQEIHVLNYLRWNPIVFGTFFAAFVLLWMIPYFWFGFSLLTVAYVAPLATYVILRNKQVERHQRVLTIPHIRYWLSLRLKVVGIHISAEALDPHETGPPVKLFARGGPTERDENIRLLSARQSPGLRTARQILAGALGFRATAVLLDYAPQGVAVRCMVDGVWLDREPQPREAADPALEALKLLCGLKPQDRQSRQEGPFAAEFDAIRYSATLTTQGTKTGERAIVQFEEKKVRFGNLEELGMRQKVQEQLNQLLDLSKGFFLFSAMPAAGLRSTTNIALRGTDRLMREFMAVEENTNRYEEVENVPVTTYKAAKGETPATVLPKVFRAEPNVVVVRDLVGAETLSLLCREAGHGRMVIGTIRAKDTAEALLRVLAMKVPPAEFAKVVSGVLCQRLTRKLCEVCKEAYAPTPEILKQMGIPEGRLQALYRPPQQPEKVCPQCHGVGYFGRTAIFELLPVGENVRKVLTSTPKLDLLRAAARKDGMRSLQEEGILLVAKGVTSLPELMRVLKQ